MMNESEIPITVAFATTAIAVFCAIGWDMWKRYSSNKNNIKNIKDVIKGEIQDNVKGLKDHSLGIIGNIRTFVKVQTVTLSTGTYESSINSGHFVLLPFQLQSKINDYYIAVKLFNLNSQKISDLTWEITQDSKRRLSFIEDKLKIIEEDQVPQLFNISDDLLKDMK